MTVLDTHIWVRWLDPQANPLPTGILGHIEAAEQLAVSAITCWELAWLVRRGRLTLSPSLAVWLEQALDGSGVACIYPLVEKSPFAQRSYPNTTAIPLID